MRYLKADMVLPAELLKELQKYISGEMIYIPSPSGLRKEWGQNTGAREKLQCRNNEIKLKFKNGLKIKKLCKEYFLSEDSIKKIVYNKNNT